MCACRNGEAELAAAAESAAAAKELWPDAVKAVILSPSHELTAQQVRCAVCMCVRVCVRVCVVLAFPHAQPLPRTHRTAGVLCCAVMLCYVWGFSSACERFGERAHSLCLQGRVFNAAHCGHP